MTKTTEEMIYSQITENTGRHFLDSGGAYGRHWERNQMIELEQFKASPSCTLRAYIYGHGSRLELDVTKSLFHTLVNVLNYVEPVDKLFHRFVDMYEQEFWDEWDVNESRGYGSFDWDKAIETFVSIARQQKRERNFTWSGQEFIGEEFSGYTYNTENILSQDFIYDVYGDWVFIRTHNGCDARGGFSYPHLYHLKDDMGGLVDNSYTIGCANGHWWDFECGNYESTEQNLYLIKGGGDKPTAQFMDMDSDEYSEKQNTYIDTVQAWKTQKAWFDKQDALPTMDKGKMPNPELGLHGVILIKDDEAYCPICGELLHASSY